VHRACASCAERESESGGLPSLLSLAAGGGQSLDRPTGGFMETRFGQDFSHVRVHIGHRAADSARAINALAFTMGNHIVFGDGQYAPHTNSGRRIIAHELAHTIQQGAGSAANRAGIPRQRGLGFRVQRLAACPNRVSGEVARSRSAAGILATDVVFNQAARQLDIADFAVSRPDLPAGVTTNPDWQRAMSLMGGDPFIRVAVTGYTDCAGSDSENLSLRNERAAAVIAAMPPAVRGKVLFSHTYTTVDFPDTNATEEGRAHNRAARVTFVSAPPRGMDPCDSVPVARTLDEYLFLVRCMETRLGLTAAADTPTALSVLRQIYYGSSAWSASRTSIWNIVIPDHPWSPGNDPTAALHPPLMSSLQASQVVEGSDIGHIMTGIDAMLHPQFPVVHKGPFGLVLNLANEEWATWAGDVGSAAAEWAMAMHLGTASLGDLATFFTRFAGDSDLVGDLDAFAMRAGGGGAATPPAQLMQTIHLTGPLSNALLQYFRITSSALGAARGDRVRNFVEAYGGVISGHTLTNRAALNTRLQPSVGEFARMYALRLIGSSPNPPPGALDLNNLLILAIDSMTARFVGWLEARL
jgi:hypothetical protein